MDIDKIALVLCVDCNKIHSLYHEKILYEEEAIQACIHWRKNAGWLKDIQIYGICNCIDKLNKRTISKLEKLDVKLMPVAKYSDYGLYNTVYAQYWFETNYQKYEYFIFIDLDIYLLKEIPKMLFQKKNAYLTYFKPFDKHLDKNVANVLYYRYTNLTNMNSKAFNTMFIIHYIPNNLNQILFKTIVDNKYNEFFNKYISFDNNNYYLEEGLYDYLYYNNIINNKNSFVLKLTPYVLTYFQHKHLYANDLDFNKLIRNAKVQ